MKLTIKACFLGLLFPVLLQGQEIGLLRINPENLESISQAAVWGGIEEGGYRLAHEASLLWKAGAEAQLVRHGDRTSWTGSISLEQKTGYHMSSSLLLEPGYYPMDLLEFSQGTKSRQTLRMEGGFQTDLGYEWAAGARASFRAAHAGKQQDVPHSTVGMEAELAPVLTYVMDDDMGFVSSYLVRLRTERVKASPGDPEALFLDQGLRFGTYKALGSDGLFPIRELSHGFDELFQSPEFSLGLGILWKRGEAGGSGNGYRFPGSTLNASFGQTFLAENTDHQYHVSYQRQRDQLRAVSDGGSVTSLSDRVDRNVNFKYEVRFLDGILNNVALVLDGNQRNEYAQLPATLVKTRRYDWTGTLLSSFTYGFFDLDINVLVGDGLWKNRGPATPPEGALRLTDDWLRKMDYLMAYRMGMGGSLTGRIPFVEGLSLQLYVFWHHAFNTTLLPGKNREIVTLKAGYSF